MVKFNNCFLFMWFLLAFFCFYVYIFVRIGVCFALEIRVVVAANFADLRFMIVSRCRRCIEFFAVQMIGVRDSRFHAYWRPWTECNLPYEYASCNLFFIRHIPTFCQFRSYWNIRKRRLVQHCNCFWATDWFISRLTLLKNHNRFVNARMFTLNKCLCNVGQHRQ